MTVPFNKAAKLVTLCQSEGFTTIDELLESAVCDSISPAICMTEGCDYTCEMEPDQDAGYCEECHTNTMKSALVLAGLI
jgi:hypothetical protein